MNVNEKAFGDTRAQEVTDNSNRSSRCIVNYNLETANENSEFAKVDSL